MRGIRAAVSIGGGRASPANGPHGRYSGAIGAVASLTDTGALICRFRGEISPKWGK
ncbi:MULTISPECIES: hypothetical protein [unclassified Paenibacillus]|uniref:hypothetical protein n=1 Tax=unclassified Paenibacillus TaxID=185978 RepID=UPI0023791C05|nr:hypothetical protein [Paenibacillus sp. MAHUQ-63]